MPAGTIPALPVRTAYRRPAEAPKAPAPSEEDIRLRAYEIYLERGAVPGSEVDDWLRAERELKKIAAYHRSRRRVSAVNEAYS